LVSPKVDITPADVNWAAGAFAREQSTLDDIWDHLAQVLDADRGMAGNDKAATTFAARYDPAAKAAWSAFGAGIRTLGGVANGLVTTANNYLKAEAHSTATGSRTPQQFNAPAVLSDVLMYGPAPAKGDGDSAVPEFLQKFWPNGHPDRLRNAAGGWSMAAQLIENLIAGLSQAVVAITDNNRTDCVTAMQDFWESLAGSDGLFGELVAACHRLADACNRYAQAIDDAHDRLKTALVEAGIAVGLTTAAGILLSAVTFGGSDAVAAEADEAEVAAIAGSIVEEFEATVATEAEVTIGADVATSLESIAADAPTVEAVEAETTEVQSALDAELTGKDIPARPGDVGSEVEVPGTEGPGQVPTPRGNPGTVEDLNPQQAANYQRYAKKLPAKNEGVDVELLDNGGVRLSSKVPANNVPGSYAEYIKILDKEGNTVQYVKDTYASDGTIVHSKIK
jgi:hypothetical protein